jgi:hypothetical protein
MLTPELQVVSRWAYVNGTYLLKKPSDKAVTAAVCALYPCVRTYTASVSNGQLSGKADRSRHDAIRLKKC